MKPLSQYLLVLMLVFSPALNFSAKAQTQTKRIQTEKESSPQISESAMQEIETILEAKRNRTPEQRKIDSQLLTDIKEFKAQKDAGKNKTENLNDQRVTVEIRAQVTDDMLELIKNVNGEVISSSVKSQTIRAKLPLEMLEGIAARNEVKAIRHAPVARTNRKEATSPFVLKNLSLLLPRPDFGEPKKIVQRMHSKYISLQADDETPLANAFLITGPPNSQGDIAHRAKEVRETFNAAGKSMKIGVLSDSSRGLAASQVNGNLPKDVTVLPGQSGVQADASDAGEGTAMMEIIYDLAPESKLFFASAFESPEQFAQNILDLRFKYGCDIIVDDVGWSNEATFQDNDIAQAVNAVTGNGGLYFSSAGNQGNDFDGTSTTWEGDFKSGGNLPAIGGAIFDLNDFGEGVISNRFSTVYTGGAYVRLLWADPWGEAENDYDLFVLDSTLTTVRAYSANDQSVFPFPIEDVGSSSIRTGDRIVIVRYGNSQPRALHLDTFDSAYIALTTDGGTYGHSAAADAYAVAAVAASTARGGAFTGGVGNPVEAFSTDGPRRIFFNEDGTPITPGNYLFETNGGFERNKPDIAAADGVATSVTGFTSFFGTSAAAPHAAAIAAMIKGAKPGIKNDELRKLLTKTALDIGPKGRDKVSGYGLLSPLNAYLQLIPSPFLELNLTAAYELENANFNKFIEPGERGALRIIFKNNGTKRAEGVKAKVTTTTPGVKMIVDESDYWQISEDKAEANLQPFKFDLASNAPCGYTINFTVTVSDNSGSNPRSFPLSVLTGRPAITPFDAAYKGTAVAIPDGSNSGVSIKVPVTGLSGAITRVAFRINGTDCTKPDGAGLQHDKVGDLAMALISPAGSVVTLMNLPGGAGMPGKNFCNTLLDDSGRSSIQSITPSGAPYSNLYRPVGLLSTYIGQNPNGIWDLRVFDFVATGAGKMNSFSILIYTWDCQKFTQALTEIEVQQ